MPDCGRAPPIALESVPSSVSRTEMEQQVGAFATDFTDWDKLIGLKWYLPPPPTAAASA